MKALIAVALLFVTFVSHADEVLFVGNSLTGFNNMPGLFLSLAQIQGRTPHVSESIKFGQTLSAHLNDPAACALATAKKWDAVVLQEYSDLPLREPAEFRDHVFAFQKLVPGVHIFLFQNWPYRDAKTDVIEKLNRVYDDVALETGATVVHLGRAMEELRTRSTLAVYVDVKHPAPIATYMGTLMMLDAIYGLDPLAAPPLASGTNTPDSYVGAASAPVLFDLNRSEAQLVQKTAARFK